MAKMFVANCTNQVQSFMYHVIGAKNYRNQPIDIGRQVQLSGDLDTKQIESIAEQHARYGMVKADELDRATGHIPILYSVDKPVSLTQMRRAAEHNKAVLLAKGRETRQAAALAVNASVESQAPGILNSLELSIEEQENRDGREREVDETIVVDKNASEDQHGKQTNKPNKKK